MMIDTLSELIPMLDEARTIRSFWGVRPLYEPPDVGSDDPTDITRDFFLLDHDERDDLPGMTSIVGGKFTTYRMMGEQIADHVCGKFGIDADCRTADVPLPGSEDFSVLRDYMDEFGLRSPIGRRSVERLGSRADEVLKTDGPNPTVCECEGVTRAEIQDAIEGPARTSTPSVSVPARRWGTVRVASARTGWRANSTRSTTSRSSAKPGTNCYRSAGRASDTPSGANSSPRPH